MTVRIPRPSRSVPDTWWTSQSSWQPPLRTLAVLLIGLVVFGVGEGLLVVSNLGATPWTVFALGLVHQTGWSIGVATVLTSAAVMIGWIPLRQRVGLGSLANAVVFPFVLNITVDVVPAPTTLIGRIALMTGGLVLFAMGASLYLTCHVGPGPRDGLMTGLQRRTGWPVAWIRSSLEFLAMGTGWLMGGHVGVGTLIFVLVVGYEVAMFFSLWRHVAPRT